MRKESHHGNANATKRYYRGAQVPMREIRRFARKVAQRFRPDKIILFGSYAYGQPHEDSDVDILVVMPARNEMDQAGKIRLAVDAPFPMDLLVRTPKTIDWRVREGDWFLREIVEKGKVLYEKTHGRVGAKSGTRSYRGKKASPKRTART